MKKGRLGARHACRHQEHASDVVTCVGDVCHEGGPAAGDACGSRMWCRIAVIANVPITCDHLQPARAGRARRARRPRAAGALSAAVVLVLHVRVWRRHIFSTVLCQAAMWPTTHKARMLFQRVSAQFSDSSVPIPKKRPHGRPVMSTCNLAAQRAAPVISFTLSAWCPVRADG